MASQIELERISNRRALHALDLRNNGMTYAEIGADLSVGANQARQIVLKGGRIVRNRPGIVQPEMLQRLSAVAQSLMSA